MRFHVDISTVESRFLIQIISPPSVETSQRLSQTTQRFTNFATWRRLLVLAMMISR